MKSLKYFILFPVVFYFLSSSLFSQTDYSNEILENSFLKTSKKNNSNLSNHVDSIIVTQDDEDKIKHIYKYNLDGNLETYFQQNFENDRWVPSLKFMYAYNSNGKEDSVIFQKWSNILWIGYSKLFYTYNSKGNMILLISKIKDNGIWQNEWENSYTYDSSDKIESYILRGWSNEQWLNFLKNSYTYDHNGDEITELTEKWTGREWLNFSRKTSSYDANRTLAVEYFENWNDMWTNNAQNIFTYDSNENNLVKLEQLWENNKWESQKRTTNTFNTDEILSIVLVEKWQTIRWNNFSQCTYSYESNGNMIALVNKWDGSNWLPGGSGTISFSDSSKREFNFYAVSEVNVFYSSLTDVHNNSVTLTNYYLSQNYPNPFNPTTTIEYSIPVSVTLSEVEESNVTLKIYNILGKEIKTLVNEQKQKGNYTIEFDASSLPSGIYFYKLQSGSFSETKKMIFLK